MGGDILFIFDFAAGDIMDAALSWLYQKIVDLFGELFAAMNMMGVDLFAQPWVNQIVNLFSKIGWSLFAVGIIVALFEYAIESQNGRGDPKTLALNIIKGFMAVNLFTVVPLKLYGFAVSMQSSMSGDMTGLIVVEDKSLVQEILDMIAGIAFGPLLAIFIVIMTGYAVSFPVVVTLVYAFLAIRFEDTSILDFIKYAVKYFFIEQQDFRWKL